MRFYVAPYEIHFDDTMAYGSHHFMTNFRFQCAAREGLLFSDALYRDPAFREDFDRVILYTAEAYSRNLGPANLGDRLVVLLSVEERTTIGLRFCFRVLNERGQPVSVGFQSVLCASREGMIVAFPPSFEAAFDRVAEIIEAPGPLSFRDAVLRGGKAARDLFPDAVRRFAQAQPITAKGVISLDDAPAALPDAAASGDRQPTLVVAAAPAPVALPAAHTALLLGGQGTFDPAHLGRLVAAAPEAADDLRAIADVVRARLGLDVAGLLAGDPALAHPDLDQVGIFLSGVLGARRHAADAPGLVIGHSFGELAALVVGGVWTIDQGAAAVCERILALRGSEGLGGLAAVGADDATTRALITDEPTLTVAGRNHDRQTVVAGAADALDRLATTAGARGVPVTLVPSRYPFHHPALQPAAVRFAAALASLPTAAPVIPVWSPIDGRLYSAAPGEVAAALAGHLTRPFDFADAVRQAHAAGVTTFLDTSGGRVGRIVTKVLGDAVTVTPVTAPEPALTGEALPADTIAIVSLGCLFPAGGRDPQAFWQALLDGRCGVSEDLSLEADFVARPLTADKALTTLAGRVDDADLVAPAGLAAFDGWCRAQRLLAVALSQAASGVRAPTADRVACLLGSTADGSDAFDDALAAQAMVEGTAPDRRDAVRAALGAPPAATLAPHHALTEVVRAVIGDVRTTLVDAACASSLYTVALGAAMLRSGEADLVLAGGAFAPGPGNNALFSQFKGLSTTGIRPFDASADGVVFGEGAGIIALKRLADAERDGDRVHAVLRGVGLSSDGRSSSANVPRAEGQLLAVQRAYTDVDPDTVAFVEAHGTATPAGDATELDALNRFFGGLSTRPLPIGSLKAHTGHLGWVAGVASLIKLCKMLEHGRMVRQHAFTTPGKGLAGTRFEVLTADRLWPRGAAPRRAATSGFGFGGTDAHVVLEEHTVGPRLPAAAPAPQGLAIVAWDAALPAGARLPADQLTLPASIRALPDLVEDLDATQRLAVSGVHRLLTALDRPDLKASTALVLALEGKTERAVEAMQRVLTTRVGRQLRAAEARGVAPAGTADAVAAHLGRLRPSTGYTLQGMMPNVTPGRVANLLDLKGPNLVVDEGASSLAAALAAAPRLLALGSDLVIAGGVHVGATVPDGDGRARPGDGLVLVALMTPDAARAAGLPVLALVEPGGAPTPVTAAGFDRRGAQGGEALVAAISAAREGRATAVSLPGGATFTLRPATAPPVRPTAEPVAQPGFGAGVPVRYATPTFTPRPAAGAARAWAGRRVLVLGDAAAAARLTALGADVLAFDADVRSEATAAPGLADAAAFAPDAVLLVRRLAPVDDVGATIAEATSDRHLLDLAFLTIRQLYPSLTAGGLQVCALHLRGVDPAGTLHPTTGQLAGMLKSIAREAPVGQVRVCHADHDDLELALDHAAAELSAAADAAVEAAWIGGCRHVRVLQELTTTTTGPSPLSRDSVIVATGGAKGVTAVLVEELLRRHGCTVVLVGRSTTEGVPADLLAAPEAELDDAERAFYAEAAAADPTVRLPELRRRFARWRSAHELHHTLAHLATLPGRVVYMAADVTRQADVEAVLETVLADHGRLDLIVHGAGMQTSKRLDRRKLDELRANLDVKLLGLRWLHEGAERRFGAVPVHALTSAFSYFGNDGQADYGAANETLDRLCAAIPGVDGRAAWTSIGWLAWDRIGMTRSPEYAVLGAARNLRGVSAAEGAALFSAVIEGQPTAAVYHQLTDGEIAWYGLDVLPPAAEVPPAQPTPTDEIELSTTTLPVLEDHLVRGTPTVPGAWTLDRLVPDDVVGAPVIFADDITFSRFVRAPAGRTVTMRVEAGPAGQRRLVGDITHSSGAVLQSDVEHASATFTSTTAPLRATLGATPITGERCSDPYCGPASPIGLSGPFQCLDDIRIGQHGRSARFTSPGRLGARHLPALLLDAAWRLSAMRALGADSDVVHAPVQFARAAFDREALARCDRPILLRATTPRVDGDLVHCDRVEAVDDEGRVLLSVEGGLARRIP